MKLVCFLTVCCVSSVTFAECQSAHYRYTLTGKAEGEMIKIISCEDQNHLMTINAKTHVSRFGRHVAIEQTVMGSYASDQFTPTLSTLKDSREKEGVAVDVPLSAGEYDTLSFVYACEQDLSQNKALPVQINILQNGQIQLFDVTQASHVKLDTALGSLDTIKVTVNTKADSLTYWFASLEDGRYTMVQSDIAHGGDRVFLAKLQA